MTLEKAISSNPYDETIGNMSAYARYIRYNVDGFYEKSNEEVREILRSKIDRSDEKSKELM